MPERLNDMKNFYDTYQKIKDTWYEKEFKNIKINIKSSINIIGKGNVLEGNNEKNDTGCDGAVVTERRGNAIYTLVIAGQIAGSHHSGWITRETGWVGASSI